MSIRKNILLDELSTEQYKDEYCDSDIMLIQDLLMYLNLHTYEEFVLHLSDLVELYVAQLHRLATPDSKYHIARKLMVMYRVQIIIINYI